MQLKNASTAMQFRSLAHILGLSAISFVAGAPAHAAASNLAPVYTGSLHSTMNRQLDNISTQLDFTLSNGKVSGALTVDGQQLALTGSLSNSGSMVLNGKILDKSSRTRVVLTAALQMSATGQFVTGMVSEQGVSHRKKVLDTFLVDLEAGPVQSHATPAQFGKGYSGHLHSGSNADLDNIAVAFANAGVGPDGKFGAAFQVGNVAISGNGAITKAGVVIFQGTGRDTVTGIPVTFVFNGLISATGTYLVGFGYQSSIVNGHTVNDTSSLALQLSQ